MDSLFQNEPIVLQLQDADIVYYPLFFEKIEAYYLFEKIKTETPWKKDQI